LTSLKSQINNDAHENNISILPMSPTIIPYFTQKLKPTQYNPPWIKQKRLKSHSQKAHSTMQLSPRFQKSKSIDLASQTKDARRKKNPPIKVKSSV
jgi:hypothetical protein